MTEKYFVPCECGSRVRVELFDAGTTKVCPACRASVAVPGSTKLKELSGDRYPYLRPIEKLQQALADGASPFDGYCHVCDEAHATYQIPIQLNAMVERHVHDNGGVRLTMTGNVELHMGAADEQWRLTKFPFLLCTECHTRFESAKSYDRVTRILNRIMKYAVFFFVLYLIATKIDETIAFIVATAVMAVFVRRRKHPLTKRVDRFVVEWISRIRWMPETLAAEDEYELSVGESRALVPVPVAE